MKRIFFILGMLNLFLFQGTSKLLAQELVLKSNLLYDLTGTIDLGGEYVCGASNTVSLHVSYNPWECDDNKKMKLLLVQPEFRWWKNAPFMGLFTGVQASFAQYNMGGTTPFTTIRNNRYQGTSFGGGVTMGYHWMLGNLWNLEVGLSFGYLYFDYNKYGQPENAPLLEQSTTGYWGVTRLGLSLVYFIR